MLLLLRFAIFKKIFLLKRIPRTVVTYLTLYKGIETVSFRLSNAWQVWTLKLKNVGPTFSGSLYQQLSLSK